MTNRNLPIRWQFRHEATLWKATPGDTLRYRPDRPSGQRFTLERVVQMHEGSVDKLLLGGALTPCDGLTLAETRERLRDQVLADAYAPLDDAELDEGAA